MFGTGPVCGEPLGLCPNTEYAKMSLCKTGKFVPCHRAGRRLLGGKTKQVLPNVMRGEMAESYGF